MTDGRVHTTAFPFSTVWGQELTYEFAVTSKEAEMLQLHRCGLNPLKAIFTFPG